MVKKYIPDRGDICWASLNPTIGREQKGRRPVLILSSIKYNQLSELVLICPLTSKMKGYPFEVKLSEKGVFLADHLRSISWKERDLKFIIKSPPEVLIEVFKKINILLNI